MKFNNSTSSTDGTSLALKVGALDSISKYDNLYLDYYARFLSFDDTKITSSEQTCTSSQELNNVISVGIGVRWFFSY